MHRINSTSKHIDGSSNIYDKYRSSGHDEQTMKTISKVVTGLRYVRAIINKITQYELIQLVPSLNNSSEKH